MNACLIDLPSARNCGLRLGGQSKNSAPAAFYSARNAWLALDATSFGGGDTRVDGVDNPDYQENSRLGVTLSIPFGARHSRKLTYSEGATTRRGNDFESFMVTWQHVKF